MIETSLIDEEACASPNASFLSAQRRVLFWWFFPEPGLKTHRRFAEGVPQDEFHQVTGLDAVRFARVMKGFEQARVDSHGHALTCTGSLPVRFRRRFENCEITHGLRSVASNG
jgi:hypothetical protein